MKKIAFCLLILLNPLCAAQDVLPTIKQTWSENNLYYFLDIEIDPELEFEDVYRVFTTPSNVSGVEIKLSPLSSSCFTKDNCPLKNASCRALLLYDPNSPRVNYEVTQEFTYEGSEDSLTEYTTEKGEFFDIDIDIAKDPVFHSDRDTPNKGWFAFRKLK